MRLSSRPPTKAKASDTSNEAATPDGAVATASEATGGPAIGGQPLTGKAHLEPLRARGIRHHRVHRLRAVAALCRQGNAQHAVARRPNAARAVRHGRSRRHRRRRSGWPCRAGLAGRPAMSRASACASTVRSHRAGRQRRAAASHAPARSPPACAAVLAADGTRRLNSPDCGMQITLQTSQSARSFTSNDEPRKVGATATGTGSSKVPS